MTQLGRMTSQLASFISFLGQVPWVYRSGNRKSHHRIPLIAQFPDFFFLLPLYETMIP